MKSVVAAVAAATVMAGISVTTMSTIAEAAVKSSAALRSACGADARKLCASVVSNTAKRNACMQAHYAQLSDKCKEAIKAAKK